MKTVPVETVPAPADPVVKVALDDEVNPNAVLKDERAFSRVTDSPLKLPGILGPIAQLAVWFYATQILRSVLGPEVCGPFIFYWATFTAMTGFWELCFVSQYQESVALSSHFISTKTNVWTSWFINLTDLLGPTSFPVLFYADYGAWADREYMAVKKHRETGGVQTGDIWSRLIESTHMICCGGLCILSCAVSYKFHESGNVPAQMLLMGAMSAQFMNSILYMGAYGIQCGNTESVNFRGNPSFPEGCFYIKRPFMLINLLWSICPLLSMIWLVFHPSAVEMLGPSVAGLLGLL